MKTRNVAIGATCLAALLAAIWAFEGGFVTARDDSDKKEFVCPPCGCESDDVVFEKAGACPSCGMGLIEKDAAPSTGIGTRRRRVAILIFDGVQIIDYAGPYEVFGQAGFEVFTVAAAERPITTAMRMRVIPTHTLDGAPEADVIVVPGGNVRATQDDPEVIEWIRERSRRAEHVLSVCNGAFILARTGLLDGLTATTFYDLTEAFKSFAPETKVVTDRRFVDNGKIITTAGISSGIDGSLHVISRMRGAAAAQMVALNMEYNWQPDSDYARGAFADSHIRRVFGRNLGLVLPGGSNSRVESTRGATDAWEVRWRIEGEIKQAELVPLVGERLRTSGGWSRRDDGRWSFTDQQGAIWSGVVSVEQATGEPPAMILSIRVARTR